MKRNAFTIKTRIWIDANENSFIGAGRVLLLENIKKEGSISGAAKNLKMSYRQAWQIIEDINSKASKPYVEKKLGGKGGGGATLTETGRDAIKNFKNIEKQVHQLTKNLTKSLNF